jgi:hypothetical protein
MNHIHDSEPSSLFFVFGWKGARMSDGPYYVTNAPTLDHAIAQARRALTDHRWTRTTAGDVRRNAMLWDSAAV